jgi:hypothetical protein
MDLTSRITHREDTLGNAQSRKHRSPVRSNSQNMFAHSLDNKSNESNRLARSRSEMPLALIPCCLKRTKSLGS